MKHLRRSVVGVVAAAMMVIGLGAGPASAQTQDGLVNVNVGDVTILQDVRVGVGAVVAANVCGVKVGPVAILGRAVDLTGTSRTVCTTDAGPVTISQNG